MADHAPAMVMQTTRAHAIPLSSDVGSVRKLARLAWIAEQYGFMYDDALQQSRAPLRVFLVRDPSPAAQQRAAATWAAYPRGGSGGPLPEPTPEQLRLYRSRIVSDTADRRAQRQILRVALLVLLAFVAVPVGAFFVLGESRALGPLAVGVPTLLVIAVVYPVTRRRYGNAVARLRAAGFRQVTDAAGRTRQLPPGTYGPV